MLVRRGTPASSRLGTAVVCLGAALLHLAAQAGMVLVRPEWTVSSFRQYFAYDQLGYLTMVANTAAGQPSDVEPLTGTGANHYPRLYYVLLGHAARLLDVAPTTAWQVGGLLAQSAFVVALAATLVAVSRRPWTGLLAPAPFVLGTFAYLDDGGWFKQLDSHAVLWGPFGVLFTLNGEAAALCAAGTAVVALLWAWLRPTSLRVRTALATGAGLLVGVLASVQTYTFVAVTYLVLFVVAAHVLLVRRSAAAAALSAALLVAVPVLGPVVAGRAGQLPTLVFGLLPTLPALFLLVRRYGVRAALPLVAVALGALPQVLSTAVGIAQDDPFLAYRVVSNSQLGVGVRDGLVSALPVLLPLGLLLVDGLRRRCALRVALPAGGATAWLLLASNDRWGVNAEPYRLWIGAFLLLAVAALVVGVEALDDAWRRSSDTGADVGRRRRWPAAAATAVVVVVAAVSALDWVAFARAGSYHGLWDFTTGGDAVRAQVASRADVSDGSLVAADPCIDATVLRVTTTAPVASFHLGMAWPERREELQQYLGARATGELDATALAEAGGRWLLTDTVCGAGWDVRYRDLLDEVARGRYVDADGRTQVVRLFALRDPRALGSGP